MLNTGIVLLTILIDVLVQILTIVEWISPSKNALIILIVLLSFKSRWTWNAFIPSILVYFIPNIKSYIQNHVNSVQEMGKLDLLLSANSLTQHALFLKDRLSWLYQEEINFCVEMMKGDLSFKVRLFLISVIFIIFGYLNWTCGILEGILLHLILKHSSFGSFYRGIGKDILRFADFALFYKNIKDFKFPPPFKLQDDNEFTIIIKECASLDNKILLFMSETNVPIDPDFLVLLKPIVSKMSESISDWTVDSRNSNRIRVWKWSKYVKFNYNSEELDFFHTIYNLIVHY